MEWEGRIKMENGVGGKEAGILYISSLTLKCYIVECITIPNND